MSLYTIIAILLTVTALFAYINHSIFKLPTAIGLMFIALVFSIGVMFLGHFLPELVEDARELLTSVNFSQAVLQGVLSFLLFAGALNMSVFELKRERAVVAVLSTVGVIISTILIGFAVRGIVLFGGIDLPLMYCFVFGALISPTDPVAVLSTLRTSKLSKALQARIAGESLFNDGMGLIMFFGFVAVATGSHNFDGGDVVFITVRVIAGGIVLGLLLGWLTSWFMKRTTDARVRVLITLACANGGYALAMHLNLSAPIAVVVAGLVLGSRRPSIPNEGGEYSPVDVFWEIIDEVLNAILFVFIGFYLMVLPLEAHELFAGFLAIPVVLAARFLSVGSIMCAFRLARHRGPMAIGLLTWGGIRGGISIAMALTLTNEPVRELLVSMTYVVVAFSVLVQGLTIRKVIIPEKE